MRERWSNQDLINACWSQDDLDWEDHATAHCEALTSGNESDAKVHSGRCLFLARESFAADDPRLATSAANYAAALARQGDAAATGLWRESERGWLQSQAWIAAMSAPRVARSSLFHMRMEQRHRTTYEDRWRTKWRELADEARSRLRSADPAAGADPATAATALGRWRRERPAMLNDTRKLMAAVFLLMPGQ